MIDYPPPLPQTEIRQLIVAAQSGDVKAKDRIIMHNMRLICKLAAKWKMKEYTTKELIQEGVIVLCKSIDYFNLDYGTQFSTYVTRSIINHYYRLQEKNKQMIYSPNLDYINKITDIEYGMLTSIREGFNSLDKQYQEILTDRLNNIPLERTGERFGVSKETIRNWEKKALKQLSKTVGGVENPITISAVR